MSARAWRQPRPNRPLMWVLGLVSRWLCLTGLPLLRRIPVVRDLPLVHGYFWIRRLDLPDADHELLRRAVNRETVAFLGPNHPEFATDWLIDKELSTGVAPVMASWADRGIVAAAPGFWGMNNLVANDGGDAARAYSVEWALRGEAVLLHPEGTVRWTNDRVHPLFPGIAQMAMAAVERTERPVFIVPVVWKYRYVGDVSKRLHREMDIIEWGLGLATSQGRSIPERFERVQSNILARQMRQFGHDDGASASEWFFDRQRRFQEWLVEQLERRHPTGAAAAGDIERRIARLARAAREKRHEAREARLPREVLDALAHDGRMAEEAKRLGEFTREVYGAPSLTQEQLSESLKRIRDRLLVRGWKDVLGKMLPRPLGPRVAHVGVPEPIQVTRADTEAALLERTRARMQGKLDEINRRIAADVACHHHLNPFAE